MPRFVVLYHEMPDDGTRRAHWDLLIEQGDVLRAWALDQRPIAGVTTNAQALPDHRVHYLDFEGEVSGNRGRVSRVAAGQATWLTDTADRIVLQLAGPSLDGAAELVRLPGSPTQWQFALAAGHVADG